MKKIALFNCFVITSLLLNAQKTKFEWAKRTGGIYSNISARAITVDATGSVYATGCFGETVDFDPDSSSIYNLKASGSNDIFISKLNTNGNFVWARNMGGGSLGCASSIALDASGNVFTTGWFSDTVDFDPGPGISKLVAGSVDIFISKLDAAGNFIWAKKIGGDTLGAYGNSIAIDAFGNVYTTGYFYDTADFDPGPSGIYNLLSAGDRSIFILKLNSAGNFVWAKKIGGKSSFVRGNSISIDVKGNVFTIGELLGKADFDPGLGVYNLMDSLNYALFILKLDAAGNFVWAKKIGSDYNGVFGKSIALDNSGVYTTGYFRGTADFDPGVDTFNLSTSRKSFTELFVLKLDNNGNFVWAKQVGTDGLYPGTKGNSITVDQSGVYTTGYFIGTSDFDPGLGIFNLTSSGREDIFISKLDINGDFAWAKAIGGVNVDEGISIAVDVTGNVFTGGSFYETVDFDPDPQSTFYLTSPSYSDMFFHKMSQTTAVIKEYDAFSPPAIYPNPTNGILYIDLKEHKGKEVRIKVLNSTGQILMDENSNNQHSSISIHHLTSGLYFVQLISENTVIAWQKIVKQ